MGTPYANFQLMQVLICTKDRKCANIVGHMLTILIY